MASINMYWWLDEWNVSDGPVYTLSNVIFEAVSMQSGSIETLNVAVVAKKGSGDGIWE